LRPECGVSFCTTQSESRFLWNRERVEWLGDAHIKGYLQESFKRDSVINLAFEFRIGRDVESFLEKKNFKQYSRRIGISVFGPFAESMNFRDLQGLCEAFTEK
jgi:hypothetical protein